MSDQVVRDTEEVPTTHDGLLSWVREIAELTRPDRIEWCDGSPDAWRRLTDRLVAQGTVVRLAKRPNSFVATTSPDDAVRIVDRTYICSRDPEDAGPTNRWRDPEEMRATFGGLFAGAMRGRTMYVVPFSMGPLGGPVSQLGVELTDSPFVAASMLIGTRAGTAALRLIEESGSFVRCVHSVGAPLTANRADVPWPSNPVKHLAHFPESREVWSFGSAFGDNGALGKKSYSLRIGSVMAREEGWLAEHMVVLKVTPPTGEPRFLAAAVPAGCGKTHLAMLGRTPDGWNYELLADDMAWMRFDADGRLRAVNPEFGILGVARGNGESTNPNVLRTVHANTLFTNVALTDDGDVWWDGMTDQAPARLTDWRGRDWTPDSPEPAAHPRAKFTAPTSQCPTVAPEWDDPRGVPISAIVFVERRSTTLPLVTEANDWAHGVFLGACLSVEPGPGRTPEDGPPRRDAFSMESFLGYHLGDYLRHWLELGRAVDPDRLPGLFSVNWFRRGEDGALLWPGYGENARVLRWIVERVNGEAAALDSAIGKLPPASALDTAGLAVDEETLARLLSVDARAWRRETELIADYLDGIGERLPGELREQHRALVGRLG
ncbi:phosphoenolpyruvate carboxykinase (GTP) [Kitasatospora purpeofusca]|uniref:phosphoenolpyruvate carboxykinase (GTP) n=2 Tax=Kitasatospora purpeofusca TaxID=67352 RepID=UPI003804E550